jgi:hypothetical protein
MKRKEIDINTKSATIAGLGLTLTEAYKRNGKILVQTINNTAKKFEELTKEMKKPKKKGIILK